MATTTKKRKKKVIKKTVSKKKGIKKVGLKTHLEERDLVQLENLSRDVTIDQKDMLIEEQYLRNMSLEFKLLEIKIGQQRELLKSRAERYENTKKKYTEFKKQIFPKYGLSENDGLGYNPETGEIHKV